MHRLSAWAKPGVYELRSPHRDSPLQPTTVEIAEDGQTIEVPPAMGFLVISHATDSDDPAQ